MKDFLGNPIHSGDVIVYAWRRGRLLGLRRATVISVFSDRICVNVEGDQRWLKVTSNVVVIHKKGPTNAELSA